jgi:hypothetical protein
MWCACHVWAVCVCEEMYGYDVVWYMCIRECVLYVVCVYKGLCGEGMWCEMYIVCRGDWGMYLTCMMCENMEEVICGIQTCVYVCVCVCMSVVYSVYAKMCVYHVCGCTLCGGVYSIYGYRYFMCVCIP